MVVGFLLIAALAGAAHVIAPAVEKAFMVNSGTARIVTDDLGVTMNKSEKVNGITLTVQRVYADANQIDVGYTVSGPPGKTISSFMVWGTFDQSHHHRSGTPPTLIDDQGHKLNILGYTYGTAVDEGTFGQVVRYVAPLALETRQRIALHFQVGKITVFESSQAHARRAVMVTEPLRFHFTVPVTPGRVANLNETVKGSRGNATLDQVVVARTGARIDLRGTGPTANVELAVNGKQYRLSFDGARPNHWTAKSVWQYISSVDLRNTVGEWTLFVKPPGSDRKAEQWIFRFTVPPLSSSRRPVSGYQH
jgi:hypothetical protein